MTLLFIDFHFYVRYRMGPFQTYARMLRIRHSWGDPLEDMWWWEYLKKWGLPRAKATWRWRQRWSQVTTSKTTPAHGHLGSYLPWWERGPILLLPILLLLPPSIFWPIIDLRNGLFLSPSPPPYESPPLCPSELFNPLIHHPHSPSPQLFIYIFFSSLCPYFDALLSKFQY